MDLVGEKLFHTGLDSPLGDCTDFAQTSATSQARTTRERRTDLHTLSRFMLPEDSGNSLQTLVLMRTLRSIKNNQVAIKGNEEKDLQGGSSPTFGVNLMFERCEPQSIAASVDAPGDHHVSKLST